jgi:proline dehydrogenase
MSVTRRALLWLGGRPGAQEIVQRTPLSRSLVRRFVAGDSLEAALSAIASLNHSQIGGILDELGEGVRDPEEAERASSDYAAALTAARELHVDTAVAVKLTQLGLLVDRQGCERRIASLCDESERLGMRLEIDMEQSDVVDATLEVYRRLVESRSPPRLAVQAYLRRTPEDLRWLAQLHAPIRLVKGAYSEPEDRALQSSEEISARYRELVDWLFDNHPDPALGTHDGAMIGYAQTAARRRGLGRRGFEVQMLYGVRRELQQELARAGYRVRTYVPYGSAWYPYLVRRLAERPANLRFFARSLLRG